MGRDKLSDLREEWYSEPDEQPETVEEEVDDEFLALNVLFKSRGVTVAGEESVSVESDDPEETSESDTEDNE